MVKVCGRQARPASPAARRKVKRKARCRGSGSCKAKGEVRPAGCRRSRQRAEQLAAGCDYDSRWAAAAAAVRLRKVLYTSSLRVEVLRMQSCVM